jgi:hypothetical protein
MELCVSLSSKSQVACAICVHAAQDIGRLFIAGFGSSMIFGTVVGSLADKQ